VLAAKHHSTLERIVAGSMINRMLRNPDCPLLVLKDSKHMEPHTISCCLTLEEEFDQPVIEWVKKLGNIFNAHISLIHALEPNIAGYMEGDLQINAKKITTIEELYREEKKLANQKMENIASELNRAGIKQVKPVVLPDPDGVIHHRLVKDFEKTEPDLVIIGTHGRTGLKRVFYGSVAQRILEDGQQNLLIIKNTDTKE